MGERPWGPGGADIGLWRRSGGRVPPGEGLHGQRKGVPW